MKADILWSLCDRGRGEREPPGPGYAQPPPEGDEAHGSKLPCGSLDAAESEQLASCEVVKKTWVGPAFA